MRTAPSAHRIGSYVAVLAIVSVMVVGSLPGLASAPARSAAPLSTHSAAGSITSGHTTMAPRPSTLSEVWARLSVGAPSPRSYYGAAWDPQLGGLLIFGGCEGGVPWGGSSYCSVMTNETWVFVGNQWENLTGPVAPSPRLTPMMAYDPSTGGVLLFGGVTGPASSDCATDTWLYTASGWQELYPSTVPGCAETGMDFDGNLGHVLLVASASGTDLSAQENVSWEFAGGSWTVLPATSSFNRVSPMMIYDSTDQETVLFGGFDLSCGCQNLQDTWVFRQGAWTEIYPAQSPGARNSAAFTDDPSRGGALMWGGHYAYQFYNDTWLFHNGSWDPLPTPVAPEYAWAMQMVLDPSTSSVILYGGYNFTNSIGQFSNETWLYAYPSPFTGVNLSIAPSRITVGEEAVLFAGASGGLGDLTYTYYGLPAGCSTANTSVLLCVPTSTGSYPVLVNVTDQVGRYITAVATLSVTPAVVTAPLSISEFVASPSPVTQGDSLLLAVVSSGGSGGNAYSYSGLPTGCLSVNAASFTCTPTQTGTFSVEATVNDSVGTTVRANASVTVQAPVPPTPPPPGPTLVALTALPDPATVGDLVAFEVESVGGVGPLSYSYTGLPAGCSNQNTSVLLCTPTAAGSSDVTVSVTDSLGRSAVANATATVGPAHPTTGNTSSAGTTGGSSLGGVPDLDIALAAVAAAVLAGVVAVVAIVRGRRPPASPGGSGAT